MTNERIAELAYDASCQCEGDEHADAKLIEQAIRQALDEALSEQATDAMTLAGRQATNGVVYMQTCSQIWQAMCAEKRKEWLTARPSTDD